MNEPLLLQAIARMEGWQNPDSRCRRNNNPGNIERGRFASAHGSIGDDGRYAVFPSSEVGFAAMRALLESAGYRNLTVAQALTRWAPPAENDTKAYIRNVCEWAHCEPNAPLTQLLGAKVAPPIKV